MFYLRPKKVGGPGTPWYDCVPVGREKLRTYMETMRKDAGITEKKTNHSLRATGASALFNAGVPEKLIRDVTGHRSNALQLYERPTVQQKQSVSRVLVQGETYDDTGKDNALQLYKCPSLQQRPVPGVHVQGQSVFGDTRRENALHTSVQQHSPVASKSAFGSIFSGLSHCSVNISPQNFIINVGSAAASSMVPPVDTAQLLEGIDLDDFLQ